MFESILFSQVEIQNKTFKPKQTLNSGSLCNSCTTHTDPFQLSGGTCDTCHGLVFTTATLHNLILESNMKN